jgi:ribosome-binding protein aMBF1 (putative translation factor)
MAIQDTSAIEMPKEFAEFVVNMRTAAGMTVTDLAHHLCLSVTTLELYESSEKMPLDPAKFEFYLREIVKQEIRKQRGYCEDLRYMVAV